MKIQQLPDNAMVTSVCNTLSREKGDSEWSITLFFKKKFKQIDNLKDGKKFECRKLRFSNIPMIAGGRIYNSTEPVVKNKHKQVRFLLKDLGSPIGFNKNYFEYLSDIVARENTLKQIKIRIPKLELARVLFFHNSYLAESSLQERVLDLEFELKQENGKNIITVLSNCSLRKTQFEDLSLRSKLSWLLLNPEVKKSYYSIYENLVKEKIDNERLKEYLFNFIPPKFSNLIFQVEGYVNNNEILYVDEILGIKGIDSGIFGEVVFEGNKFIQEVPTKNSANIQFKPKDSLEPCINDEYEANSDLQSLIVDTPKAKFEFLSPIISSIKPSKTINKATSHSESSEIESEIADTNTITVATDEATTSGRVSKGEFQNTEDITNRDVQYRQNFLDLENALKKLDVENLEIKYHILPKVSRCKCYKKADGNIRQLFEAKFSYRNLEFIIFEVDTTDLPNKRLSTLIVRKKHNQTDTNYLAKTIVKNSLTWCKLNFSEKVNLNHPKDFYTRTSNYETMIGKWSQRIENTLNQLIDNE